MTKWSWGKGSRIFWRQYLGRYKNCIMLFVDDPLIYFTSFTRSTKRKRTKPTSPKSPPRRRTTTSSTAPTSWTRTKPWTSNTSRWRRPSQSPCRTNEASNWNLDLSGNASRSVPWTCRAPDRGWRSVEWPNQLLVIARPGNNLYPCSVCISFWLVFCMNLTTSS